MIVSYIIFSYLFINFYRLLIKIVNVIYQFVKFKIYAGVLISKGTLIRN
jgi:hypothetical protein